MTGLPRWISPKPGVPCFSDNIPGVGRSLVAMVPSAPVLWGLTLLLRPNPDSKLSQLVCATVPAVGCLAMYYFAARRLHIAEVSLLRDMIVNRLGGSRRRGGAASPRAGRRETPTG
jgi:hypothetical protein